METEQQYTRREFMQNVSAAFTGIGMGAILGGGAKVVSAETAILTFRDNVDKVCQAGTFHISEEVCLQQTEQVRAQVKEKGVRYLSEYYHLDLAKRITGCGVISILWGLSLKFSNTLPADTSESS